MTSRTIDNGRIGDIFAIVDEDGPYIYECEKEDVGKFLKGEDEREDVVRNRLSESINRVECVTSIGSGHDPFVVWFMEYLVDQWMMQTAVNEVDPEIGKDQEDRELRVVVPHARTLGRSIV